MDFGLARVSKREQNESRQVDLLIEYGVHPKNIYIEKVSRARKKENRPVLMELLESLQPGDRIVVTRLARLAGSLNQLVYIMEQLKECQVELVSINENIDTSTPTGRLITNFFGILSEYERELIVERTKEGLKSAREKGRIGGRRPVPSERIETAIRMYESGTNLADILTFTGISKSTFYKYKRERENDTHDN